MGIEVRLDPHLAALSGR